MTNSIRLFLCILIAVLFSAVCYAEPVEKYTETISSIDGGNVSFDMVLIGGGQFLMGSKPDAPNRKADEGPVRSVKLDSFYLCPTETTHELFWAYYLEANSARSSHEAAKKGVKVDAVTGPTPIYGGPGKGSNKNNPAIGMRWHNAVTFCKWLSAKTGKEYRLPTEAEWEYAARAGGDKIYGVTDKPEKIGDYAWYFDNSDGEINPVAGKKPNAYGLYDMAGNVREWVWDYYSETGYTDASETSLINPAGPKSAKVHVARGGDYDSDPEELRCASRAFEESWWSFGDPQLPKSKWWLPKLDIIGFRIACSQEDSTKQVSGESESGRDLFALCMETHDSKKRNLAQQAALLKELGYAGCGHLWLDGVEERVDTLDKVGLRLYQVYVNVDLSKEHPLDYKHLAEVLPKLTGHRTQLALLIKGGNPSDNKLDDKAAAVINRIAEMAKPYAVTVVLYPHRNDWLEKCSDAVRLAKKVNRPGEVGVMFNLCHWMLADTNRDLVAVLEQARPWLMAVTLNGTDIPEKVHTSKQGFIKPLGKGEYHVTGLMKPLADINYSGPVGLQCWGLTGDARIHLEKSMATWKNIFAGFEPPRFLPTEKDGEFSFNTGVLSGVLRPGGSSRGLSAMTYLPDNIKLDGGSGIFGYYRNFSKNKRYGTALWDRVSKAKLLDDGAVEAVWSARQGHPYDVKAVYRLKDNVTLDLETVVTPTKDLEDFEVFLASYFNSGFPATSIYIKDADSGEKRFLEATDEFGVWQMYPRNKRAVDMNKDGRWKINPNPVDWQVLPEFAAPLAMRTHHKSDLKLVVMACADDCFAISTPCKNESHYSLYLSLIGKDLSKDRAVRTHTRFLVANGLSDKEIVKAYQNFLKEKCSKRD